MSQNRGPSMPLLMATIFVLAISLLLAAHAAPLDGIKLVSSYFEPGVADVTNTDLSRMGMAYLRFKIPFQEATAEEITQDGLMPFSVQVNLGALAVPLRGKDPNHNYYDPTIILTTQGAANPLHTENGELPTSQQNFLLPLLVNQADGSSSTPVFLFEKGLHESIRRQGTKNKDWAKQNYSQLAHYILVTVPLHRTLFSVLPTFPLSCAVTFTLRKPNALQERTLVNMIYANESPSIVTDVQISPMLNKEESSSAVDMSITGNYEDVIGFNQKWGYMMNVPALIHASHSEKAGPAYLVKSGKFANLWNCYKDTVNEVENTKVVFEVHEGATEIKLTHPNPDQTITPIKNSAIFYFSSSPGEKQIAQYTTREFRYLAVPEDGVIVFVDDGKVHKEHEGSLFDTLIDFPSYLRTDVYISQVVKEGELGFEEWDSDEESGLNEGGSEEMSLPKSTGIRATRVVHAMTLVHSTAVHEAKGENFYGLVDHKEDKSDVSAGSIAFWIGAIFVFVLIAGAIGGGIFAAWWFCVRKPSLAPPQGTDLNPLLGADDFGSLQ